MADPWHFFAALQAWRMSTSRKRTLCESPWQGDVTGSGVRHCFVLARARRQTGTTEPF